MRKNKVCAFCEINTDFTREHIFPSGIIESFQIDLLTISDKNDSFFKGDPVIKDVCATCNNEVLSQLDSYFVKLFKEYMGVPLKPGNSITFEYDYNLLLRELLKISYNSARASKNGYEAVTALKRFLPYIIHGNRKPSGVIISLQLVTSAHRINIETNSLIEPLEPYFLRSTSIDGLNLSTNNYIVRMVAFNSFWFYLLIPKKIVNSKNKKEFWDEFKKKNHLHGVLLKENESIISITKEKTTYLHPTLIEGMMRKSNKR